jgi:glycosyltransferase involved in cell wall biosynthesis
MGHKVKVLHLVAGELSGGAARGAYSLHQAQLELGVDSTLINNSKATSAHEHVVSLVQFPWDKIKFSALGRLGNFPTYLYRSRQERIFNTGFSGVDFTKLPDYKRADIVHLHWINGLVAMRTLRNVSKPVVWTMRDMWPLTGGCHYSMDCDRYQLGCGYCPQLASNSNWDLTKLVVANKRASFPKKLQLVGISEWLSECARASMVFAGYPVQTITNNIDTKQFFPVSRELARQALGIPNDRKILLVGAQRVTDFYKGFDLFLNAAKHIARDDVHILSFGHDASKGLKGLGISFTDLGFLADTVSLRMAYSAADIFVAPYRMEAFGKTLAESLACGTPVVCFDATGTKDIVIHNRTGFKAEPFDPASLAGGINQLLKLSQDEMELLRVACRQHAVEKFDSRVVAAQYLDLYERLLER